MERTITASASTLICISTIFTKIYLCQSLPMMDDLGNRFRAPSLILPDLLVLLTLMTLIFLIRKLSLKRKQRFLRFSTTIFTVLLAILVTILDSSSLGYYQLTTAVLDWRTAIDFLKDYKSTAGLASSNSQPTIIWGIVHLISFILLLVFFRLRLSRMIAIDDDRDYQLLDGKKGSSNIFWWKKPKVWVLLTGLTVYYLWARDTNPLVGSWSDLSSPILVSFIRAVLPIFKGKNSDNESDSVPKNYLSSCQTLGKTFEAFKMGKTNCTERGVPDFSFTRRNETSSIRNIVLVYLESARNDILPLEMNSTWVRTNIDPEVLEKFPITPFMSRLVRESVYYSNLRTISSYTIKSLFGTLCSVVPLPVNRAREWNNTAYCNCLPGILKQNNWDTFYFSSASLFFEHQHEVFSNMGYNHLIGPDEMEFNRKFGEYYGDFEETNYFGVDDIPMVKPTINWMNERRKSGIPTFVTLTSNVNHDPYYTPRSWGSHILYNKWDEKVNRYLNTARYTDRFVEVVFNSLREGRYFNDTLFVILGDHGMALGEHGRVGTNENAGEELIKVPLFFYSENEHWKRRNPPRRYNENRSSLDIIPTILEMLWETDNNAPLVLGDYFEGQSLKRHIQMHPLIMTIINPGGYAIVYREGNNKLVIRSSDNVIFYDLEKDPLENYPRAPVRLKGAQREWCERVLAMDNIYKAKIFTIWKHREPLLTSDEED